VKDEKYEPVVANMLTGGSTAERGAKARGWLMYQLRSLSSSNSYDVFLSILSYRWSLPP